MSRPRSLSQVVQKAASPLPAHQEKRLRDIYHAFDFSDSGILPTDDLQPMLQCLGLGPDVIPFTEVEDMRLVLDPTRSGVMTLAPFLRVVGRVLNPLSNSMFEESDSRSRSGSLTSSSTGASARPRSASVAHAAAAATNRPKRAAIDDEDAKGFRLFDVERRGYVSVGDLIDISRRCTNSMLTEGECSFIVNTLQSSRFRDGLSVDDFSRALSDVRGNA